MQLLIQKRCILYFLIILVVAALNAICDVVRLTNTSGNVESPNIKLNDYNTDYDIDYSIAVSSGLKIKAELTFYKFNVNFQNCTQDWLEIFMECNFTSSIGKLCALVSSDKPFQLYSLSGCLGVRYHTVGDNTQKGFKLKYETENENDAISTGETCGSNVSMLVKSSPSLLKSPDWPQNYPKDKLCTFIIEPPKDSLVVLYILHFDMENNPSCDLHQDLLLIKVGNSSTTSVNNAALKTKYCQGGKELAENRVWIADQYYPRVFVDVKLDGDVNVGKGYLISYIAYTKPSGKCRTCNNGDYVVTTAFSTLMIGIFLSVVLASHLMH